MEAQEFVRENVNRILVVLDARENRKEILDYAIGLGRLCGASLLFACPFERPLPMFSVQSPAMMMPPEFWEDSVQAQKEIDSAVSLTRAAGVDAEGKVVSGTEEAMSSATWKDGYDIIVVSRPKRRGFERLLRGDVALDVVKSSGCPVMVLEGRRAVRSGRWSAAGQGR